MGLKWTKCSSYLFEDVYFSILKVIENNNFPDVKNKTVLLKPNLLGAYSPDMHVTTHPSVLGALIDICREKEAKEILIGDSHNGLFPTQMVLEKTGIKNLCEQKDVSFKSFEDAELIEGVLIAKCIFDIDVIINIPKLKTHGLTLLTCAVKNLFGCVPGMKKSGYHRLYSDRRKFDEFLVKLAKIVNPNFTIVDGIIGMEGNGPSDGEIRNLNLLIAGDDVFKIDELVCNLIGINPLNLGVLRSAKENGLWTRSLNEQKIIDNFKIPYTFSKGVGDWWIAKQIIKLIFSQARVMPIFNKGLCKKCKHCLNICPAGAISFVKNGYPDVDRELCFECFCCHESCSYHAIKLKRTLGVRFAGWCGRMKGNKNNLDSKQ